MSETVKPGRFALAVVAAVVGVGGGVSLAAWKVADVREEQDRKACERSVANRDDGRAVWLYLVARDPERRDDPDVVEFVRFLNDRLPPLTCDGSTPVPTTP